MTVAIRFRSSQEGLRHPAGAQPQHLLHLGRRDGLAPRDGPCYEPDLEKQVSGQYHGLPTVSIPVETDWLWVSVVKDQTASPSILESELRDCFLKRRLGGVDREFPQVRLQVHPVR